MWEILKAIVYSQHPLSGPLYLVLGAVLGVFVSNSARRPKLIFAGAGTTGGQDWYGWQIGLRNFPSLLGKKTTGDDAKNVVAWLQRDEPDARPHPLSWDPNPGTRSTTIEPGESKMLTLFRWAKGRPGYFIADSDGQAVEQFTTKQQRFLLTINDTFGRIAHFRLTVIFDATHLREAPTLMINHALTFSERLNRLKLGFRHMRAAFRKS